MSQQKDVNDFIDDNNKNMTLRKDFVSAKSYWKC